MKTPVLIGINFVLFLILRVAIVFAAFGLGYSSGGDHKTDGWILLGEFILAHLAIMFILQYFLRSLATKHIILTVIAVIIMYGLLIVSWLS
ncbi:MAG: hypothetical protein QM731_09200 [Chitinophagaceae bacterium]